MTAELRNQLAEQIVETQPQLRAYVQDVPPVHDLVAGSWNRMSYSFQQGFEALWDCARAGRGVLLQPLLALWRQSVELALKASILEVAGSIQGSPGHDLDELFSQLLRGRTALGYVDDDDLTDSVRAMIALAQTLDPLADRFRYPTSRSGKAFEGVEADLDELFQAHWIIVTYCEGAAIEVREMHRLPW